MATYGFSDGDAKRIGRTVRLVERFPEKVSLGMPGDQGAAPGVRLIVARHSGQAWATQTEAVVTAYSGDPCVAGACNDAREFGSAFTMIAVNQYIEFSTETNQERWVSLGHNGYAWTPVDSQSVDPSCLQEVGGVDFRRFSNWAADRQQLLGHDDSGCIRWYDVFTCATAASCT